MSFGTVRWNGFALLAGDFPPLVSLVSADTKVLLSFLHLGPIQQHRTRVRAQLLQCSWLTLPFLCGFPSLGSPTVQSPCRAACIRRWFMDAFCEGPLVGNHFRCRAAALYSKPLNQKTPERAEWCVCVCVKERFCSQWAISDVNKIQNSLRVVCYGGISIRIFKWFQIWPLLTKYDASP